jgi:hypothetical protein
MAGRPLRRALKNSGVRGFHVNQLLRSLENGEAQALRQLPRDDSEKLYEEIKWRLKQLEARHPDSGPVLEAVALYVYALYTDTRDYNDETAYIRTR